MTTFKRRNSETSLVPVDADVEFKPFRETYKIITFTMVVGMLYPTPETERCRVVGIIMILVSMIPICVGTILDMWSSWLRGDIINIIRHSTVMGPFAGAIFKIWFPRQSTVIRLFIETIYYIGTVLIPVLLPVPIQEIWAKSVPMMLFFYSRKEAWAIIKTMDADHARCNTLPESHKEIARTHIQNTQYYSEKCWSLTVATCVLTFPLTAVVLTFYNFVFKEEPVKYMIHDIDKPFSPREDRFSSPYYEITFFYMGYCSLFYIISFTGFDAFFGITINHTCMKMELACKTMEDAMLERDRDSRHRKMLDVITEQNDFFRMVELIQETFNIWLGIIVIATMLQICNCMYQIIEGYGIDPRYLVFIVGTIAHIYLPCRYAAKLRDSGLDVATRLYCCGWERVDDERARKMATFMIARAQVPMKITAFNMFDFDMELFVSILQSSYSIFTLLRS